MRKKKEDLFSLEENLEFKEIIERRIARAALKHYNLKLKIREILLDAKIYGIGVKDFENKVKNTLKENLI